MECPNCGFELKENEVICPVCQMSIASKAEKNSNNAYQEYKENEQLNEKYGFNKLLIFSIKFRLGITRKSGYKRIFGDNYILSCCKYDICRGCISY